MLERLGQLLANSTPGPWSVGEDLVTGYGTLNIRQVVKMAKYGDDLKLIAAAVNALPALLAVAKAAKAVSATAVDMGYSYAVGLDEVDKLDESIIALIAQLKEQVDG